MFTFSKIKQIARSLWGHQTTMIEDDKQVSLLPAKINEKDKQYSTVLNLARKLQEENVLNIAVTGPYGSGKSSILRTLIADFPKYKYLPISLATLKSPDEKPKDIKDVEAINARIEYSILQQIEYTEKQETIYNSRFKRVFHQSKGCQYRIALAIILYIIALLIVYEPSLLKVDWIYRLFSNAVLNYVFDTISIIYILFFTTIVLRNTIKSLSNSKLSKVNVKDGEIELDEDTSVFNKHMDEIIYFFQATDYEVVILEDLDRFENTDIFLKLREVNLLLNHSKSIGRKIVFIYAVRDDMFLDKERTKFFDYITTVIPIINSSNSIDKFKEEFKYKCISDIDDDTIENIAFFVDDMRLLKNIVNEYAQYRCKLENKLDSNKLLAMIVYKNYYPKDFANLHKGKGVLHSCLQKKEPLLIERNKQIDIKIDEIREKINCAKTNNALQEKELRLIYIDGYRRHLEKLRFQAIDSFRINGTYHTLSEIADNESLFNSFTQQSSIDFRSTYSGSSYVQPYKLSASFESIERSVNSDYSYKDRLNSIRNGEFKLKEELHILELSKSNIYSIPIRQLISSVDMQKSKIFKKLKISPLLETLLKEGLIDEDYFDYISLFFGESIDKHDHDFVLDVKLGHILPYDYSIDKTEQCIKYIPQRCYNNESILNIKIADYLCQHIKENDNESKLLALSQTIRDNKKWDYLLSFYEATENASPIFETIANITDGFWGIVKKQNSDSLFEAWIRHVEINHSTIDSVAWLSNNYSFISKRLQTIGIETIRKILSLRDIVFTEIDAESTVLLEYVIQNNYYKLTPKNVSCALVFVRNERVETYEGYRINLSIIKNCEPARQIYQYINNNISDNLTSLFITDAAKEESPEIIQELIDSEKITLEAKSEYLTGQKGRITLKNIKKDNWLFAIEHNLVIPLWDEVYSFFESQGEIMTKELIGFISNNISDLKDLSSLSDIQRVTIANRMFLTSKIELDIYKELLLTFDKEQFIDEDISNIDAAHIHALIAQRKLAYSSYYVEQLTNIEKTIYDYVDCYFDENIEEIGKLPQTKQMLTYLLKHPKSKGDKAVAIVKQYSQYSLWDKETATLSLNVVSNNIEQFDINTQICILTYASNSQDKGNMLLSALKYNKDNVEIVERLLSVMEEPYCTIADKSKKAKLNKTDINYAILQTLQNIEYISSFSENDGVLRVNHKSQKRSQ